MHITKSGKNVKLYLFIFYIIMSLLLYLHRGRELCVFLQGLEALTNELIIAVARVKDESFEVRRLEDVDCW